MFRHVDRHANELDFIWCKDHSCCGDWQFKTIFQCFKVPTLVLRTFYEDHFDTFLWCIEKKGDGQIYGDENQPTVVVSSLSKCSMCPNYRFSSKMEQDRHKTMFHCHGKSVYKKPTFECEICNKKFTSQSSLNRQKLKEDHNRHAIANTDEPPKKRKHKTKQRTINEMLHNHQDWVEVNESDGDKAFWATNCQINLGRNAVINWICCEECDRWYHSVCVDLENKSEIDNK